MLRNLTMITFVLIFTVSMAFSSGFSVYEHGAKATAMGGAFIAQANDPSAVFYNPAGITALKGTQFGLGITVIMPKFAFTGPAPSTDNLDAEAMTFPIPHLYVTHNFNEQWSAGFGMYSLFCLGSEWEEGWVGRELSVIADIKTIFFNPVIVSFFEGTFISRLLLRFNPILPDLRGGGEPYKEPSNLEYILSILSPSINES